MIFVERKDFETPIKTESKFITSSTNYIFDELSPKQILFNLEMGKFRFRDLVFVFDEEYKLNNDFNSYDGNAYIMKFVRIFDKFKKLFPNTVFMNESNFAFGTAIYKRMKGLLLRRGKNWCSDSFLMDRSYHYMNNKKMFVPFIFWFDTTCDKCHGVATTTSSTFGHISMPGKKWIDGEVLMTVNDFLAL